MLTKVDKAFTELKSVKSQHNVKLLTSQSSILDSRLWGSDKTYSMNIHISLILPMILISEYLFSNSEELMKCTPPSTFQQL